MFTQLPKNSVCQFFICTRFPINLVKIQNLVFGQTIHLKQSKWKFEKQSSTFDVTLAFILFRIIYIVQEAWVCGNIKTSRKYRLEIGKQIAALKFQIFVLSAELRMALIWKCNLKTENFIFSVNYWSFVIISQMHCFLLSAFPLQFKIKNYSHY